MEHWYQWLSTGRERLGMERLFREVSAISEEASAAEAGDVAKCSEALRALMNEALANPAPVWSTTQAAIAAGLVRLDKACDAATAPSLVAMGSEGLAEVERFRVGVLDVDSERGESVGRQLEDMGYDVAVHGDVESLERDPEALNVLLLAHDAGPGGRQAASLSPEAIGPIVASLPGRPALVVASWRGDLGARLRALRAGAVAFLPQPIAAEDLATAIEEIAERARDGALRALVIDGDARAAGHASALLRRRGFVVRFIHDVADALPAMAQASPDVVVSGISFPEHTGLELAKVLRQDPRFAGTPFVFVAPDESVAAVRREVRLGGDEVVPMALRDAELADVALGRACRYRALRSHLSQDALTGCASQDAVREALKVELSRAHRDATPVSHAVVEIDRLAAVSKRFGPAAADRAVLVLARLLRQRLRRSDLVGRHGASGFAIVLPLAEAARAAAVLDEVRAEFAGSRIDAWDTGFTCTFSAGVAAYPAHGTVPLLREGAERGLEDARKGGGGRVVVHEGAASRLALVVDDDEEVATLVETILRRHGFRVALAHDGKQAMRIAGREMPDVAVLDLLLPGTSGFDLCRALKARDRATPVILMSGVYRRGKYLAEAKACGAEDLLSKPIMVPRLMDAVAKALQSRNGSSSIARPPRN